MKNHDIKVPSSPSNPIHVARVSIGDKLFLGMADNPTTGYRWAVKTLPEGLLMGLDGNYASDVGDSLNRLLVGAGGRLRVIADVVGAVAQPLILTHFRPWDYPDSEMEVTIHLEMAE